MRWIFLFVIFCTSCCYICEDEASKVVFVQKVDVSSITEVIIPYAVELGHTHRLRFEDAKVYYDEFAERIRVIWSTQAIMELCEARDLIVTVTEGLLERLNESSGVITSFDHYPLTADDLELMFSCESDYIRYVDPTYMAWLSLHDGIVYYYNGLLKDPRIDFWDERKEPYYKAAEFVMLMRAAEAAYKEKHEVKKKRSLVYSL